MKTLLLLRHAKSSWDDSTLADHDRPLNERGERDAPRVGKLLQKENLVPDMMLSSDANRARATAELVARHCVYNKKIIFKPSLYGTDPGKIIKEIQKIPGQHHRVLVVGHNPELEMLVEMLAHHFEKFPTAALAHFEIGVDTWGQFSIKSPTRLKRIWRPKDIAG